MEPTLHKLAELKGKNPFKIPENYMEGLTEQIMAGIPEVTYSETKVVSLRDRIRPWMYVAAVFAGLLIMFRVFISPGLLEKEQTDDISVYLHAWVSEELLQAITDDDLEYLDYIESQYFDREFAEEIDNLDY